jgi:hypothetical protein
MILLQIISVSAVGKSGPRGASSVVPKIPDRHILPQCKSLYCDVGRNVSPLLALSEYARAPNKFILHMMSESV